MSCKHSWMPSGSQLDDYTVGAIWECDECGAYFDIVQTADGKKKLVPRPGHL